MIYIIVYIVLGVKKTPPHPTHPPRPNLKKRLELTINFSLSAKWLLPSKSILLRSISSKSIS